MVSFTIRPLFTRREDCSTNWIRCLGGQKTSKVKGEYRRFCIIATPESMLGGSPCHHSKARPQVVDGRDGLQLEVSCEYIG
jgi:hypothetical protein